MADIKYVAHALDVYKTRDLWEWKKAKEQNASAPAAPAAQPLENPKNATVNPRQGTTAFTLRYQRRGRTAAALKGNPYVDGDEGAPGWGSIRPRRNKVTEPIPGAATGEPETMRSAKPLKRAFVKDIVRRERRYQQAALRPTDAGSNARADDGNLEARRGRKQRMTVLLRLEQAQRRRR